MRYVWMNGRLLCARIRICVLYAFGALILWEGMHEIVDVHEKFDTLCQEIKRYNCGSVDTGVLGLCTAIAAVATPIGLSKLWTCRE